MLDFQPITPGIKVLADSYTFKYGEGSCQHSFVSSWTLRHKYGDSFCEHEGFLYTLREKLCNDSERVYLFPFGPRNDPDRLRQAVQNVLDDTHAHNCRAKFQTVTQSARDAITAMFPGMFMQEYSRNWSEYIYDAQILATYSGAKMAYKRRDFQRFGRDYYGRVETVIMTEAHIQAVRDFQAEWLKAKLDGSNDPAERAQVLGEDVGIQVAFDDWTMLGLTGIVILVDGAVRGYAYGARLSEDYVDEINENCDKDFPNIYPFAKHEFARLCCQGIKYLNFEEDIGSETLRSAKQHYKPVFLLDKYILTEK